MGGPVPDHGAQQSRRRGGRHWVVTAVGMPALLVWGLLVTQLNGQYGKCIAEHGPTSDDSIDGTAGPCYTVTMWTGALSLGFLAALVVTLIVGVVLGIIDGRGRRRFAYGRWVCVVVVGLTGTHALVAYALAYGLGRLLPAHRPPERRPHPSTVALQQGWIEAIHLYQQLTRGAPPPAVVAPGFIGPGAVYLDAPLTYSRFYGTTVTYGQSSTFAFGSTAVVAGALVGDLIGNSMARSRATKLAQPQWREFTYARVVVTPTTTWCSLDGRWLAFDHDAVLEYALDGPTCVLAFAEVEPLRLAGPSVWHHAIMFAYARYGPAQWHDAPFLRPIRDAAHNLSNPTLRSPQQTG